MSDFKVFFDTSPFIYLVENHPVYYPKVFDFIKKTYLQDFKFFSSVLTYYEFCVKPLKLGRNDLIFLFEGFISDLDFKILDITFDVSKIALNLKSKYLFLKPLDVMQLATAIEANCSFFLTNDKKLTVIKEIQILCVDEF